MNPHAFTTFTEAQEALRAFRDERGWAKHHTPEALARAIAVEAGELNEIFLWYPGSDVADPAVRHAWEVREELADVLIYCLNLCNTLGADAGALVAAKLGENAQRRVSGAKLSK